MSFPLDCACTPPTITPPVNVIGSAGGNAYSFLAAQITLPTLNNNVTITVDTTAWMVIGQYIIIGQGFSNPGLVNPGPGLFQIMAIASTTSLTGRWVGGPGDVASGAFIDTGATVSPAYSLRSSNRGTATLSGGTVTVSGVVLTPSSLILATVRTASTPGFIQVPAASRNVGAGTFIISSSNGSDASTVDWMIFG